MQSSIYAFRTAVRMIRTPVRAKQQVARQCSWACSWSVDAHARADLPHVRAGKLGRMGVQAATAIVPSGPHARADKPHDRADISDSVFKF